MKPPHLSGGALASAPGDGPVAVPDGGWELSGSSAAVESDSTPVNFYSHGWHSFSPSGWSAAASPAPLISDERIAMLQADRVRRTGPDHSGSAVGCAELEDGRVLLLGSLSTDGWVALEGNRLVGHHEGSGEEWFAALGEERAVLDLYADALRRSLGARPTGTRGAAWCSWYSYYENISEERMATALAGIDGLGFEIFQTDDGWQRSVGDWWPNSRFPSGMDGLAERVRSAGLRPGLWLAPFCAHEQSELFQSHQDWFVADETGAPEPAFYNWGGWLYGLDLTRDDVREHLRGLFGQLVAWGYDYLKLDFLFAGAIAGRREGPGSREEVYRSGIELIRESVGGDVYLLACGAPAVASLGVFDGLRVSGDVGPVWSNDEYERISGEPGLSARTALRGTLNRYWLHDLIDIDPDVTYFRSRGLALDGAERALLQDLARVSGRLSVSDPPDWLTADERTALRRFLAERPEIVQTDRYRFTVDGRDVDFAPAIYPAPRSGVNP